MGDTSFEIRKHLAMTPKRKAFLKICVFLAMLGFVLPPAVWGGVWVGVQGGWNFASRSDVVVRTHNELTNTYKDIQFDPHFLSGVTLGYDFVKDGAWGRSWPSCIKYFSLTLHATHEVVSFQRQTTTIKKTGSTEVIPDEFGSFPDGSISMILVYPMIMGRYGFLTSPERPAGRVQPYVGAGMGFVITNPKISGYETLENNKLDGSIMLESGLRVMIARQVSLDAAFSYQYIFTQFGNTYRLPDKSGEIDIDIDNAPHYKAILRLSYHF